MVDQAAMVLAQPQTVMSYLKQTNPEKGRECIMIQSKETLILHRIEVP